MSLSTTPEYVLPNHMRKKRKKPGPKSKAEKIAQDAQIAAQGGWGAKSPLDHEETIASFLHSPDSALRLRYGKTLNKDEALRELARLRKICEVAATEINQRLVPDETKCLICKRELPPGKKVTMMTNIRDEATGTVTTHPVCSVECVKELNKVRMGLAELIK